MYAGIDTHKDTLAIAVIDHHGRLLASQEVANTERGFTELTHLIEAHHVVRVGIEGSGAFGRAIAVHLAMTWQPDHSPAGPDTHHDTRHDNRDGDTAIGVVEVPTLMTARERRAQTGKGKTDPVDALAIARITAREPSLPPVRLTTGTAADLRALLDYRGDLIAERTALTNRVHADLVVLLPGYHRTVANLSTRTRIRQVLDLLDAHPAAAATVRGQLTRRRLERAIAIDAEAAQLKRDIDQLVQATGTSLTQEYGIGPLVAARLLAEVVDIRRYPTRETFAAANGTAPIPASSGRTVRHRYNPGGNRQLNRALFTVALTQIGADTEGRAYYRRKRAEGKTHREAMRCLKRRLSDVVYRYMHADASADAAAANTATATAPAEVVAGSPHRSPDRSPTSNPVGSGACLAADAADANGARLTA